MPTNDERRTIARRLRRCSPTFDNALTFLRVFEAVYGTLPEDGAAMGMPRYLATLIDRERCEMGDGAFFNGRNEYGAECSNCECAFEDAEEAHTWHYCPNCGAEVVD